MIFPTIVTSELHKLVEILINVIYHNIIKNIISKINVSQTTENWNFQEDNDPNNRARKRMCSSDQIK